MNLTEQHEPLPDDPRSDEGARVENWRWNRLLAMGFGIGQANDLARRRDVDLYEAQKLIDAGCPPSTAFRILS